MRGNEGVIERAQRLSIGERAALRRMAGQPLSVADGRALQAFFHALPPETQFIEREQRVWFTVLCIACLWDVEEAHAAGSLAGMLRSYTRRHETNGMDNRFRSLLDARWDEDGYLAGKLARLARMLRADDRQAMPDMDQLLDDLRWWNSDGRRVQLRWANEYYLSKEEEETNVD